VFQYAVENKLNHPFSDNTKIAGKDWFTAFSKRNNLSLRRSEGLSRARAAGATKLVVQKFYDSLEELMDSLSLNDRPETIYNMDETGMPLNNRPPRVVAARGSREVNSLTSAERGENVTVVACCNATGAYIPPS
jgi:hypothetical protein